MVEGLEEGLPDDERALLRMIVYEKLSYREIARQTGTSKSTVHRQWQRLAGRLRSIMSDMPGIEEHLAA